MDGPLSDFERALRVGPFEGPLRWALCGPHWRGAERLKAVLGGAKRLKTERQSSSILFLLFFFLLLLHVDPVPD